MSSFGQRREVIVRIVNAMRDFLDDHGFGPGVTFETPIEKRVKRTERRLAELVWDTLDFTGLKELKQRAPDNVWTAVERDSKKEPHQPLHMFLSLGHIKQLVVQRKHRPLILAKLRGNNGFRNSAELEVA